jgi:carnitine-CoA ligase
VTGHDEPWSPTIVSHSDDLVLTFPDKRDWVVPRILEHQAAKRPDASYVQFESSAALSFDDANREANRLAHGMRRAGLVTGDRILLMLPNCPQFLLTWFGLNKIGAVPVCLNTASKGEFLEDPVNRSKARTLVTTIGFLATIADSRPRMPLLERIYVVDGAGNLPPISGVDVQAFEELWAEEDTNPVPAASYPDLAVIVCTGGTTGPAKLVLICHAHAYWMTEQLASQLRITPDDTHLTAFPLFHGSGLFGNAYSCLIRGAHSVIYPEFSASEWIDRVRRHDVTVTNLLASTMDYVMKQPERPDDGENSLRAVHGNGQEIRQPFMKRFGVEHVAEGFGSTEIALPVMTPYGIERPIGACGKLMDEWYELRLVDPVTGESAGDGDPGEAIVRPKIPWIMTLGYEGRPDVTARAMRNLWWHTGDLVRTDSEGWYYFVDRSDDSLRVRGENMASYAVEEMIMKHPAIEICAVVGVAADSDAPGDQELKACLVLKPGAELDHTEFIRFCSANGPWFAVPRYVEILADLPRNEHGKLRKGQLRYIGTDSIWDRVAAGVRVKK